MHDRTLSREPPLFIPESLVENLWPRRSKLQTVLRKPRATLLADHRLSDCSFRGFAIVRETATLSHSLSLSLFDSRA